MKKIIITFILFISAMVFQTSAQDIYPKLYKDINGVTTVQFSIEQAQYLNNNLELSTILDSLINKLEINDSLTIDIIKNDSIIISKFKVVIDTYTKTISNIEEINNNLNTIINGYETEKNICETDKKNLKSKINNLKFYLYTISAVSIITITTILILK